MKATKKVLIFGATGNMGGAATRELLKLGWQVRAVTRNPTSEKSVALARLGADVVRADMADRASLEFVFDGIRRVFSVQNWSTSSVETETRQGKMVADVAKAAGIRHLVYGSAGTGEPGTGIPHFDAKLEVEAHMRKLDIPFSVLRPGPFMELLSKKEFYPALGAWGAEPKVVGWNLPIPWVAVDDLGVAIARMFSDPSAWIGKDVTLFGDVKTLAECRDAFEKIDGRKPFGLPLPLWMFRRMAGEEFVLMWHWMVKWISEQGPDPLWHIVEDSRQLSPGLLNLESWLKITRKGKPAPAAAPVTA